MVKEWYRVIGAAEGVLVENHLGRALARPHVRKLCFNTKN